MYCTTIDEHDMLTRELCFSKIWRSERNWNMFTVWQTMAIYIYIKHALQYSKKQLGSC